MFQGAGEVQVSAQFSRGYEAQAAVAVTDHLGIMGNYLYANGTRDEDDSENFISHYLFEGGIGYYENTDRLCFEVYAGYGKGKGVTYDSYTDFIPDDDETTKLIGQYQRFFIQPSIGTNHHKIFNWTGVMRFALVDFTSFTANGQSIELNGNPVLFFEPSFMGKVNFGDSKLFMNFQAGFSIPRQEIDYNYQPFNAGVGLGLRFGAIVKQE